MSEIRFRDIMAKKAKIDPETSEVLCPTCVKNNFTIFRRDRVSGEIYLNHCKCENCGQLFVYNVDKKDNVILRKGVKKDKVKNGISKSRY